MKIQMNATQKELEKTGDWMAEGVSCYYSTDNNEKDM